MPNIDDKDIQVILGKCIIFVQIFVMGYILDMLVIDTVMQSNSIKERKQAPQINLKNLLETNQFLVLIIRRRWQR